MEKTIVTPRGTFQLITGTKVAKLKKEHYGLHHEHNGYVVIADGKSAAAITKEDYEKYYL